ncbi:FAD-dependent oxidoreductase [Afifella sp. IM 167]|uniref:NAD(P)/FAD-dependent oxidoreductase n=1 Tax=Afifella sp. IM 167 TaxID=2033586 RepID=UPI001CCB03B8
MTDTRPSSKREGPFWPVTAVERAAGTPLQGDLDCDAAIVGAGFTGLRAALRLAEAGAKVAVFEAGEVGHGASGRSGGQVNPMLPVPRPENLLKAVGRTYFERLAEVSLGSADELFDLVRRYQIDCQARQNGWLRVDHSRGARERARAAALEWNRFGAGFEFVDGDQVRRMTGSPVFDSATLAPRGGAVQPLSLVRGLARAAESAGARIYVRSPVTELRRVGERWAMTAGGTAGRHRVAAEKVILATNGYTDGLLAGLKQSILPLTPVQIATRPLGEEEIGPVLPGGQTISDTRRLIMYGRREPDNRIVYGGLGFRRLFAGVGGVEWLLKDVARVFPSIRPESWRFEWDGQIAVTADRVPHFHEPAPGLLAGLGYNGRGVAMSLVMGRVLAERALGAEAASLPFPVSPVRAMPFRGIQFFGHNPAMRLMRLMDSAEFRAR